MFRTEGCKDRDFVVFNGPDEQFLSGRVMGAAAGIGGTYGAMPELFVKLNSLIESKELEKALQLQDTIDDIIYTMCSAKGNLYAVIKASLKLTDGLELGGVRAPLANLFPEDEKVVKLVAEKITAAKRAFV